METTERFAYPAKTKWSFTCGSSLTCKTLFTIATSQLLHVKRNELLLFIHGCSGLLEQPHLLADYRTFFRGRVRGLFCSRLLIRFKTCCVANVR